MNDNHDFNGSAIENSEWHIKNALEAIYNYRQEIGFEPSENDMDRMRELAKQFKEASIIMDMILTDTQISSRPKHTIRIPV